MKPYILPHSRALKETDTLLKCSRVSGLFPLGEGGGEGSENGREFREGWPLWLRSGGPGGGQPTSTSHRTPLVSQPGGPCEREHTTPATVGFGSGRNDACRALSLTPGIKRTLTRDT